MAGVLTLLGLAAWVSRGRVPTSRGGERETAGGADRARPRPGPASDRSTALRAPARPGGDSSVPAWDAAALAALGLVPSPASELPVPPVSPAHRLALARRAEARFDARLRRLEAALVDARAHGRGDPTGLERAVEATRRRLEIARLAARAIEAEAAPTGR